MHMTENHQKKKQYKIDAIQHKAKKLQQTSKESSYEIPDKKRP